MNFLVAGYVYSESKLAFDPNLAVADATFNSNAGLLGYQRTLRHILYTLQSGVWMALDGYTSRAAAPLLTA
jgi:hypothetical protein